MAGNPDQVAQQFLTQYYTLFDNKTERVKLAGIYTDQSMLTWMGDKTQGTANIMNKLMNLQFQKVAHHIDNCDAQPSGCGGVMVLVTGTLKVDDEVNMLKFARSFHLVPKADGNLFVHNDVFRLNVG